MMTDHQIEGARWKRQSGTVRTNAQGLTGWQNFVEVGIHRDDGAGTRIIVKASFTRAKIKNLLVRLASLEPRIQEMHNRPSSRITQLYASEQFAPDFTLGAIGAGR